MKHFYRILLVVIVGLFSSLASAIEYGNVEDDVCINTAFSFRCIINQKIDDHLYGMTCDQTPYLSSHALLKTESTIEKTVGLVNFEIKHVGKTKVKLENGFSAPAEIWEECNPAIIKSVKDKKTSKKREKNKT